MAAKKSKGRGKRSAKFGTFAKRSKALGVRKHLLTVRGHKYYVKGHKSPFLKFGHAKRAANKLAYAGRRRRA